MSRTHRQSRRAHHVPARISANVSNPSWSTTASRSDTSASSEKSLTARSDSPIPRPSKRISCLFAASVSYQLPVLGDLPLALRMARPEPRHVHERLPLTHRPVGDADAVVRLGVLDARADARPSGRLHDRAILSRRVRLSRCARASGFRMLWYLDTRVVMLASLTPGEGQASEGPNSHSTPLPRRFRAAATRPRVARRRFAPRPAFANACNFASHSSREPMRTRALSSSAGRLITGTSISCSSALGLAGVVADIHPRRSDPVGKRHRVFSLGCECRAQRRLGLCEIVGRRVVAGCEPSVRQPGNPSHPRLRSPAADPDRRPVRTDGTGPQIDTFRRVEPAPEVAARPECAQGLHTFHPAASSVLQTPGRLPDSPSPKSRALRPQPTAHLKEYRLQRPLSRGPPGRGSRREQPSSSVSCPRSVRSSQRAPSAHRARPARRSCDHWRKDSDSRGSQRRRRNYEDARE